jgi:integrase
MTNRRQLKSNRFLPEFVSRFKDRHGKERLRFRRKGYPAGYFKAPLGTEAFREEYHAFNNPGAIVAAREAAIEARIAPGSVADLQRRYYSVPERLGPTATTQGKVRSVLDRGFFAGRAAHPVASIRFEHIEAIVAKRRTKFKNDEGRWEGGNEAARKLRKELVRLFDFAMKSEMVQINPAAQSERVKIAPADRSKGFHTWTEPEIAQYRARHPLGTKARLAMELILWTDQRGCDSIHLGRQHIRDGQFHITQSKTGKALIIPIAPQLLAAIAASDALNSMCFLLNEYGKPFTRKGFGNKMRDWCDQAGLAHCTAHGLRKATMRRMAELNLGNQTMKGLSGHSKDDEVALYTAAADQQRMALQAVEHLAAWESAPREQSQDAFAKAAIVAFRDPVVSNRLPELDTTEQQEAANAR